MLVAVTNATACRNSGKCPYSFTLTGVSTGQGRVSWRLMTIKWRQFSQSNRHSPIGTRQTEYHEALPSLANVQSHLMSSFADNGSTSWYSVRQVPMVECQLGCENCCHLTVADLHDTSPRSLLKGCGGSDSCAAHALLSVEMCHRVTQQNVQFEAWLACDVWVCSGLILLLCSMWWLRWLDPLSREWGTNPLQTPRAWFWGTHKWAISAALLAGGVSRAVGIVLVFGPPVLSLTIITWPSLGRR